MDTMTNALITIHAIPELTSIFKWMVDTDQGGKDGIPRNNANPYHNLGHMLCVLNNCLDGCEYHNIQGIEMEELLVAALFHDFGHSAGKFTDDTNVSHTQEGLKTMFIDIPSLGKKYNIDAIHNIIDATEYPYVIPADKLSIRQMIIRDANLMMSLEDDWFQTLMIGLAKEMNVSMAEMIDGQIKFLSTVEFNSNWGKTIKKDRWDGVIQNLYTLKQIYFGKGKEIVSLKLGENKDEFKSFNTLENDIKWICAYHNIERDQFIRYTMIGEEGNPLIELEYMIY